MKYPKVYYQMRTMLDMCDRMEHLATDKDYVRTLRIELETRCEDIECAHLDDEYTGEMDDFADTDVANDGMDEAEDLSLEEWTA